METPSPQWPRGALQGALVTGKLAFNKRSGHGGPDGDKTKKPLRRFYGVGGVSLRGRGQRRPTALLEVAAACGRRGVPAPSPAAPDPCPRGRRRRDPGPRRAATLPPSGRGCGGRVTAGDSGFPLLSHRPWPERLIAGLLRASHSPAQAGSVRRASPPRGPLRRPLSPGRPGAPAT